MGVREFDRVLITMQFKHEDGVFTVDYRISEYGDTLAMGLEPSTSLKITQKVFKVLIQICNTDVLVSPRVLSRIPKDNTQGAEPPRRQYIKNNERPFRVSDWSKTHLSDLVWTKIYQLFYLVGLLHIIINIAYQYIFDLNKYRADQILVSILTNQSANREENWHELKSNGSDQAIRMKYYELREQQHRAASALSIIGAPHMHLGFVSECFYTICLINTFTGYLLTQIYYRYWGWPNYYFVRNYLDHNEELEQCKSLIRDVIEKFQSSSQNHSELGLKTVQVRLLEPLEFYYNQHRLPNSTWRKRKSCQSIKTSPIEQNHLLNLPISFREGLEGRSQSEEYLAQFIQRQLLYWESRGSLIPINRTPKWIGEEAPFVATTLSMSMIYVCLGCNLIFSAHLVLHIGKQNFERPLLPQCLIFMEILCQIATLGFAAALYGCSFFFTCCDQIRLTLNSRSIIKRSIRTDLALQRAADASGGGHKTGQEQTTLENRLIFVGPDELARLRSNANMLLVLIQYKIFIAQFREQKIQLRAVLRVGIIILSIIPMLCCVHLPYFGLQNEINYKTLLATIGLVIGIPFTLMILMVCAVHTRCLAYYRDLYYFLADAIDHEQRFRDLVSEDTKQLYEGHLIESLRRELSFHEKMLDDITVCELGLTFTYSDVLRIYYWYGLLFTLALQSNTGRFSNYFFEDPLGVFKVVDYSA